MKLPEYDNRPPAGTPLYDPPPRPPLEDVKFAILGVGLPAIVIVCAVLFVVAVAALFN